MTFRSAICARSRSFILLDGGADTVGAPEAGEMARREINARMTPGELSGAMAGEPAGERGAGRQD